jgi:hypothetical protein
MPLRHHQDFAGNMADGIMSSQLGHPAGAPAAGREQGGAARKRKHATRRTSVRDIPAKTP